jgi:hypothetical protein
MNLDQEWMIEIVCYSASEWDYLVVDSSGRIPGFYLLVPVAARKTPKAEFL